jgi:tungstate transport system substrate-binding protein
MTRVAALFLSIFVVSAAHAGEQFITLASTIEPQDSGLFGYLLPMFNAATGLSVHVIAVGTGRALAIGELGEADALLVHDPAGEAKFVANGYGIDPRNVMYDDFVIVGPSADPAHIRGTMSASMAFKLIADTGALFVSRGDDSGTNRRELQLWRAFHIQPDKRWYRVLDRGMAATLSIAAATGAYTLASRAVWANFNNPQNFEILSEGDRAAFDPFSSILVNPAKWPKGNINEDEARTWHEWLTSKPGRDAISSYHIDGKPVFLLPCDESCL